MAKVKYKTDFDLLELINYINTNGVKNETYYGYFGEKLEVDENGAISSTTRLKDDSSFTVELEENITMDTKIDGLVEFGNFGNGVDFYYNNGVSINSQKEINSKAFYIMNDDLTMTLIWTKKEGLIK